MVERRLAKAEAGLLLRRASAGRSAAGEEPASRSMHRNGAQHYQNAERNATAICARKEETPRSDIDFLVSFEPGATLFDQARLGLALQEMFGCKADVIASSALDDPDFGPHVRKDLVAV